MANDLNDHDSSHTFWYAGKVTRRRVVGWGAGVLGATILVPAPWRAAFGQAKPYKIGTIQPLSGPGAVGGKTALVGVQMAADRINKSGGVNGRPVELVVADDESKPDVGRRKAEKLVVEDKIDAQVGGFLSNICLACMPVWEEAKIVNIISVCLDTTLTGSKCNRYSFRPFDYAPAQAVVLVRVGPVERVNLVGLVARLVVLILRQLAQGIGHGDQPAQSVIGEPKQTTGVGRLNDFAGFLRREDGSGQDVRRALERPWAHKMAFSRSFSDAKCPIHRTMSKDGLFFFRYAIPLLVTNVPFTPSSFSGNPTRYCKQ